ncbi:MAG: outer membrane receptor for ferric coprogen and ferric-rhodotorulic acid, partial [Lentimonas sp.]
MDPNILDGIFSLRNGAERASIILLISWPMKRNRYPTSRKPATLLRIATLTAASATLWSAHAQDEQDEPIEAIQQIEEVTLVGSGHTTTDWYSANTPAATPSFLSLPPKDTPQSLTIITEQQIADFNLTGINQTLTYAPGV